MNKVCEMYLALCFVFCFHTASVFSLFSEEIMNITSYKYEPCETAQNIENQDFRLLDFNVKVMNCGSVSFQGLFRTNVTITSPLKVTAVLKKAFLFRFMIPIPCISGFGSCNVQDLCEYLEPEDECSPAKDEIDYPCGCPVKPGIYKMPGVWMSDLAKTRWAYLFAGYYTAMITLYQGGTELTCYKIEFTLE